MILTGIWKEGQAKETTIIFLFSLYLKIFFNPTENLKEICNEHP